MSIELLTPPHRHTPSQEREIRNEDLKVSGNGRTCVAREILLLLITEVCVQLGVFDRLQKFI